MAFCLFVFTAHATAVGCGDATASEQVEALRPTFPWFPIEPPDGSHAVEKCTASTPPMGSEGRSTERSDPKGPIRPASLSLGRVTWHSQRNYTIPSATENRTKPRPRPPHTPKPSPVTPQAAIVAIDKSLHTKLPQNSTQLAPFLVQAPDRERTPMHTPDTRHGTPTASLPLAARLESAATAIGVDGPAQPMPQFQQNDVAMGEMNSAEAAPSETPQAATAGPVPAQRDLTPEVAQEPADGAQNDEDLEIADLSDTEEAGYVQISYDKTVDRDAAGPLVKISLIERINLYANENDIPINFEPFGGGGKPYGPVQLYFPTFEQAKYIAETLSEVKYSMESKTEAGSTIEITINLKAFKVSNELKNEFTQAGITDDFLNANSIYSIVYLSAGYQFMHVHKKHIGNTFQKMGLTILRNSRPPEKKQMQDGTMKSTGLKGDMINTTLTGGDQDIQSFILGGKLNPRLTVRLPQSEGRPDQVRLVNYKIGVGKDATQDMKKLIESLCQECKKIKPGYHNLSPALLCTCLTASGSMGGEKGSGGRGGRGLGKGRGGTGKRATNDDMAEARKQMREKGGAGSRSDQACNNFPMGKCARGQNCSFSHDVSHYIAHETEGVEASSLKASCTCPDGSCKCWMKLAKKIKCQHAKNEKGFCLVQGTKCIYMKCAHSLALHLYNRLALFVLLCPRKSKPVIVIARGAAHIAIARLQKTGKRRLVWHVEFDSTLGFPGEGWMTKGLLFVSLNANGLRGGSRARHMFREARTKRVAALFIQEHNHSDHRKLQRMAETNGYAACISPRTEDSVRGGTAIFLSRELLGLGSKTIHWKSHLNGRVTTVEVALEGAVTTLVCIRTSLCVCSCSLRECTAPRETDPSRVDRCR